MIMKMKIVILSASLLLFVQSIPQAFAVTDGTASSGGGHRVDKEFYDSYLRRRTVKFDKHPVLSKVYAQSVEPLLKQIDEWIPAVGKKLRENIKEKTWYMLSDKKIPQDHG